MTSPPERPTIAGHKHGRVPRAVRQEQLLDIAEALFTQHGYEHTSIEDVARQAGVSRPVIYGHYQSKEGLYLACVERARALYEQDMARALQSALDVPTQLERTAEVYFGMIEANPRRWLLLFGGAAVPVTGELGQRLTDLRVQTIKRIVDFIQPQLPHITALELEAAVQAISGISEQLGHWWLRRPEMSKVQVVALCRDFVLHGVASRWTLDEQEAETDPVG